MAIETRVSGELMMYKKKMLDDVSRNKIEYEKVQWLTKDMSVPGSSAGTG